LTLSAGQILHASDLFDAFVADVTNNSTPRSSGGGETIGNTITLTSPSTSARYRVLWVGAVQSTVTADIGRLRIRYQSGASLTTSGTQVRIVTYSIQQATKGQQFAIAATITGLTAGQWTVGGTIQRASGTGTNTVSANSTDEEYLLVERIA
jgi:hypothetical protein